MVTHFAIEPHAFMAAPDGDGIAVWSSIQHPNWLQKIIANLLGLPLAKVRVFAPDPGGGFGGKQHTKYEPLVAFMALKAGRPVRLVLSLEETFQAVRRTAAEIRVRTGLRADGTIVFQDVTADYLIGAYADIADRVVGKGSYPACGPYRVPAARILARSILSHTVPSTAFRGFGNPQVNWAVESNLNEAARRLGIDPLELRLRNLARKGDAFIPFDTPADGDWEQTVRRAAELIGWGTPLAARPRPRHRRRHQVRADDRPVVLHRPPPRRRQRHRLCRHLGHGPGRADGLRPDRRRRARRAARLGHGRHGRHGRRPVRPADLGQPIDRADGQRRPRRLSRRSRRRSGRWPPGSTAIDEASITVDRGVVRLPDRELTILEVLKPGLGRLGGELIGNGEMRKEAEPGHPLGGSAAFFEFNCTAVEAEVDEETGDVTIVRHVTVSDVGQVDQPAPGPDAGRGRRDPGSRPHPDGALHLRRRGPDPEPRRDRLPDPDEHGPAARDASARRSRTATAPGRTARRA